MDPAISQREVASQTALVVLGQPKGGVEQSLIYHLKTIAGHWAAFESADHILDLCKEFPVMTICVESVAYQRVLAEVIEREAQVRGIRLPHVELVKPPRNQDKLIRANAPSGLVQQGSIK